MPAHDVATPAHTLLNLWLSHRWRWGGVDGMAFVKLDNLGDELAYNAAAIRTVRTLAPLPGRAARAGIELRL